MTIDLERIPENGWRVLNRVISKIAGLLIDTGGVTVGIRFGTQALTFTASTNSADATITHGLGRTPIGVLTGALSAPAFGNIPLGNSRSLTSTTFVLNGEVKTAFTGTATLFWLAIG